MSAPVAFAVDTFGDVTKDASGRELHHAQVIRNVVEEAVLAESVGLDAFGVGEHHRRDFAVTAPEIVSPRSRRGRSACSSPRRSPWGSFTESFPLFGYDLSQYEELFEEKLEPLHLLLDEGPVTWQGRLRSALTNQDVYPKTESGRLRTWVGVGGSPKSVVRAASYRMPLMLAIIGGDPRRFAPYIDLYHKALDQLGSEHLPVGVHSPGCVADTDERAREDVWPHYRDMHNRIGRERGWGSTTRAQFEREADAGSLYVGSPETVARRVADTIATLGIQRFELKYSSGTLPRNKLMASIALYGETVVPRVRELLAVGADTAPA